MTPMLKKNIWFLYMGNGCELLRNCLESIQKSFALEINPQSQCWVSKLDFQGVNLEIRGFVKSESSKDARGIVKSAPTKEQVRTSHSKCQ